MIECMLAAPSSGSGKTALACALLAALQKRGLAPCALKCGPDYIDPMFHRSVLGVESHNLDLFLCGEDAARTLYARHAAGHGAAVVEGVMGFYDGVGGVTARASAWHVARTLDLPVLLVLRPRGASLTLAAQVRGLLAFRQPSHIAGILLNDCSAMLAQSLAPMLEQETGVPVLGYLPHMPEAVFGSRHLGLYTAAEIDGLAARIGALAAQLEQSVDMPRLLALCGRRTADGTGRERKAPARKQAARIAVARDEAFCFAYAETLESLRDAGAELVFFSPVHDAALPGERVGCICPEAIRSCTPGSFRKTRPCAARCAARWRRACPRWRNAAAFCILARALRAKTARCTLWPAHCPARACGGRSLFASATRSLRPGPTACCCARAKRSPFTSSTIGTARKMARRSTRRSPRRAAAGRAGSRGRRCMQLSRTCILRAGRSWRSGLCVRPPPFKAAGEGPCAF